MINKISQNLDGLNMARVFADLGQEEIELIVSGARVVDFKKDKNLFFIEEKAQNFYLVLEGVVKLFMVDEEGNETILQILEGGDFVNDIFRNDFQTSAKALVDSKVVIFDLAKIRDAVKNNSKLAFNFLREMSARSSHLIEIMARLKLTDAKQKVAQFLLGMAFEKGCTKSRNINLRYDKASLASWLGINPETLSRALKKLKDDGEIRVEKNQVILLKQSSLCHYCDSKIADKCDLSGADFCTQR